MHFYLSGKSATVLYTVHSVDTEQIWFSATTPTTVWLNHCWLLVRFEIFNLSPQVSNSILMTPLGNVGVNRYKEVQS